MLDKVLDSITGRQRFVVTSHARPDGDALGSALACCQILSRMGKQAEVVISDAVPYIYRCLPHADQIVQAPAVAKGYDAAVLLECDSMRRTGLDGLDSCFLISIDHHASGHPFGHVNWIDTTACATAELVYRLACRAGVGITPDIATCLYTAVLTDTGSFCFVGTSERTFALAGELVRAGANPAQCAQQVYFSHPTSKMRLLGSALSSLHREGKLAWMSVTRHQIDDCGAFDEDAEGLVNYALSIGGVEAAVFFRELPDRRYRVSLRSKGGLNVAAIAERFGGGGHECASGFSIDGPLSVATERVLAHMRFGMSRPGASGMCSGT